MLKRVKDAQKLGEELGLEKTSDFRNYFYPIREFKKIEREYNRKSLELEKKPEEPSLIDRAIDSTKDLFGKAPIRQTTQLANIQTPPLPVTPQPVVPPNLLAQNKRLTPTEEALLSPEEKIIAERT
tara:strand:- start:7 stop:384 length:378 start_codon:yes stop_codon:yes gene_type:complete